MAWREFHKHEVGDWDTDGLVGHDMECRWHLLTFLVDEPRGGDFAPVAAVNATTFLGAPPGAVLCHGAYVTKLVEAAGAGAKEQEILEAGKDQWWALLYNMHELASLGWNTALPPAEEEGNAHRIPTDLFPPFDMAMFFGALDFPVGELPTSRAEATPARRGTRTCDRADAVPAPGIPAGAIRQAAVTQPSSG